MTYSEIVNWLLSGDVSIRYQARRDLMGEDESKLADLRGRIAKEGFGRRFMQAQNENGHWGRAFYSPKWISTHYTLHDLRNLCIETQPSIEKIIDELLDSRKRHDGYTNQAKTVSCDVCVNGMFLNYASYFGADAEKLKSTVDYFFGEQLPDGGFNCDLSRHGATHSSLHTTLSVLEGMTEYIKQGYEYRVGEIEKMIPQAVEFILMHRLYKSDKTGNIISKSFLTPVSPARWHYDILRALDYMRYAEVPYDDRMHDALDVIASKRKKDGTWNNYAKYPGLVHFDMEPAGGPGRWNTLRALRVLKYYDKDIIE